jgi:hypothetical protein
MVSLQQIRMDHAIRLPTILAICAVGLAAVYLVLTRLDSLYPDLVNPDLFRFFDLNKEANLPTWFSALLWQIAALLAFCVAQWHRARGYPHTAYWLGMIPLFLFLSLDEAAKVHETIGDMIGRKVEMTGALRFTYAWVLFGLTLVALVGLAYARLLILLRRRFALLLVMSAVLFLLGAVIVESIGAAVEGGSIERFPFGQTWPRMIAYEETLEMLGAILLIHTLLGILALKTSPYRARGMVRQAREAKEY